MFGGGRTTVVYATTEPQEALLLGGNTAVIDEGRLLQFGPALEVYHRPASMTVSEIFSDPPINLMNARYQPGGLPAVAGSRFSARAVTCARSRPGRLPGRRALQPHRPCRVAARAPSAIPVAVELAEINGSETYIHARHGELAMDRAQVEGVHSLRPRRGHPLLPRSQSAVRLRQGRRRSWPCPSAPPQAGRARLMAQIEFKGVAHSYLRSPSDARRTMRCSPWT